MKTTVAGHMISEDTGTFTAIAGKSPMTANMELALPARAENIAIVRHAFGALGDACGVSEPTLSDVRLAVTEACTNVVIHAYPEGVEGPLEVSAAIADGQLTIVVKDHGPGITPRPDSPGLGLGLPLIASLADAVALGHDELGHTVVRMEFSIAGSPNEAAGATT